MVLTDEQANAVDLFKSARSLKISAFAGTGKTSTLTAVAKSTSAHGLYLAFNKSIAAEAAEKFPRTVDCRTTHSIAYRSVPSAYRGNCPVKPTLHRRAIEINDLATKKLAEAPVSSMHKLCGEGFLRQSVKSSD